MFFYVWENGAGDRQNRWYDVEKLKVPSSSNTNSFSGVFQGQSKSFELETWKKMALTSEDKLAPFIQSQFLFTFIPAEAVAIK